MANGDIEIVVNVPARCEACARDGEAVARFLNRGNCVAVVKVDVEGEGPQVERLYRTQIRVGALDVLVNDSPLGVAAPRVTSSPLVSFPALETGCEFAVTLRNPSAVPVRGLVRLLVVVEKP